MSHSVRIKLIFAITLTILSFSQVVVGDIVLTTRRSSTTFDSFAGVGPVVERRRESPEDVIDFSGSQTHAFEFTGSVVFGNQVVSGTADVESEFSRNDNLVSGNSGLNLTYSADMEAMGQATGDGRFGAMMTSETEVQFSLDETTDYSVAGSIDRLSGQGNTLSRISLNGPIGTEFVFESIGIYDQRGTLLPGNYTLIISTQAETFIPTTTAHGRWNFSVGTAIPEPTSCSILALAGLLGLAGYRSRPFAS